MILENEIEKNAFDYICELASETTDRRGCNDLPMRYDSMFNQCRIKREGEDEFVPLTMDFDVLIWLRTQIKEEGE